ncbi:hypothetical protein SAY87_017667 [Trapa incisa]|uniref:Uncharacterized protein n=1 Tax=Trapa incisa TaxID=236973 RepID=A0AAN7L2T3_9MYRT|nr:hypothetical protein SAY87_017667 [Trapa incisa]
MHSLLQCPMDNLEIARRGNTVVLKLFHLLGLKDHSPPKGYSCTMTRTLNIGILKKLHLLLENFLTPNAHDCTLPNGPSTLQLFPFFFVGWGDPLKNKSSPFSFLYYKAKRC